MKWKNRFKYNINIKVDTTMYNRSDIRKLFFMRDFIKLQLPNCKDTPIFINTVYFTIGY